MQRRIQFSMVVLAFLSAFVCGAADRDAFHWAGLLKKGMKTREQMDPRASLQFSAAAGISHGTLRATPADGAGSAGRLDRFGGWSGKRFRATGFFRVAKDDRWWLVTPEGNDT